MIASQQVKSGGNFMASETLILLFSFITAFSVAIIIISALFVSFKKLETNLEKAPDRTFVLGK